MSRINGVVGGVVRPVVRGLTPNKGVGGSSWTPAELFGGAEVGDWWSCAIRASTFQNSAATTPAGDGDVVGGLVGQTNGHILAQGTSGRKPILHLAGGRWRLSTDGVDDWIGKAFTLNAPFTRVSAILQDSWAINRNPLGSNAVGGQLYQQTASPRVTMFSGSDGPTSTALIVGEPHVVTEIYDGAASKLAVDNGAYATGNPGASAAGGFAIGAQIAGAGPAAVSYYGSVVIGRVLTDPEIAAARKWAGALASLSL